MSRVSYHVFGWGLIYLSGMNCHRSRFLRHFVFAAAIAAAPLALSACSTAAEEPPRVVEETAGVAEEPSEAVEETLVIQQVDGRPVSASGTELILRTADEQLTFQIRPEDLEAIDPAHINSHVGVETLGFRAYYMTEAGIDYVVSVEEINGSTLGFD